MVRISSSASNVFAISVAAATLSIIQDPVVLTRYAGGNRIIKNETSLPEIVWLLSFPNSGTTYTLKSVQSISSTTTATNYGATEVNNLTDTSSGPFLRFPDRPMPQKYILTKTHCDRRPFPNCSFPIRCHSGTRFDTNHTIETVTYTTTVRRAIHLIRSPLDNVIARWNYFRRAREQPDSMLYRYANNNWTRWCQYQDIKAATMDDPPWKSTTFYTTYMESLPCALEYYRYFAWHLAVVHELKELTDRLVVYYEDYPAAMDRVVQFLALEVIDRSAGPAFRSNTTYDDDTYSSSSVQLQVQQLGRAMCDGETWRLFQRYFT